MWDEYRKEYKVRGGVEMTGKGEPWHTKEEEEYHCSNNNKSSINCNLDNLTVVTKNNQQVKLQYMPDSHSISVRYLYRVYRKYSLKKNCS